MTISSYKSALSLAKEMQCYLDKPHPVNLDDISECEKYLGFFLPPSYREFLLDFGFGGVDHIVFLGLISGDLRKESYVNALEFTIDLRRDYDLPINLFAIQNLDGDGANCLQLSHDAGEVECPVIRWEHSMGHERQLLNPHVLADNFGDYFYSEVSNLND